MPKQEKQPKTKKPTKTYQFRIYPTKKQMRILNEWLVVCCEVYNAALDERKSAYRMAGVSLSYEQQSAELPACKQVRPELHDVPSQVLQDVVKRVDRAFDNFFRRVEAGPNPRHPPVKIRFCSYSLTFKQNRNNLNFLPGKKKHQGKRVPPPIR